jgi:hypothetical protein
MIELGTWVSVIVLGPGSLLVFIWFAADLRSMLRRGSTPPRGYDDSR